jgi:hypothetical protein
MVEGGNGRKPRPHPRLALRQPSTPPCRELLRSAGRTPPAPMAAKVSGSPAGLRSGGGGGGPFPAALAGAARPAAVPMSAPSRASPPTAPAP